MAKKTKKVIIVTPKGSLVWPYLLKPDSYQGKERYKATIKLSREDAASLIKACDEKLEWQKQRDAFEAGGTVEYEEGEYLPYTVDETTGTVSFDTAMNRFGKVGKPDQFEQRPAVFDARGQVIPNTVEIYTGSLAKLRVEVFSWSLDNGKVGVSLRLLAAQVFELADRDAERSADDYGFSAEEEGYDSTAPVEALEGDDEVDTSGAEDY